MSIKSDPPKDTSNDQLSMDFFDELEQQQQQQNIANNSATTTSFNLKINETLQYSPTEGTNASTGSTQKILNKSPIQREGGGQREGSSTPEDTTLQRSICVRNVEYSATIDELKEHFKDCCDEGIAGIKRVTICTNKSNGQPLGQAFIEFSTIEAAKKSKGLDETLFKGRQLTVLDKRKNLPKLGKAAQSYRGGKSHFSRGRGVVPYSGGYQPQRGRGHQLGRGSFRGQHPAMSNIFPASFGGGGGHANQNMYLLNAAMQSTMMMAAHQQMMSNQSIYQNRFRGRGRAPASRGGRGGALYHNSKGRGSTHSDNRNNSSIQHQDTNSNQQQ